LERGGKKGAVIRKGEGSLGPPRRVYSGGGGGPEDPFICCYKGGQEKCVLAWKNDAGKRVRKSEGNLGKELISHEKSFRKTEKKILWSGTRTVKREAKKKTHLCALKKKNRMRGGGEVKKG